MAQVEAIAEIEDVGTQTEEHIVAERPDIPAIKENDRSTPAMKSDDLENKSVKEILRDILEALQDSSIAGPTAGKDDRSRFWKKYKKVAEEHDSDFLERYSSDMDIVLIFAGLFSAVSTSFIVAMEPSLLPDPSDTTNALLLQIAQILGNSSTSGHTQIVPSVPIFAGPSRTDIWVQTVAYMSLSSSLLAAFGAVLGKQWLGYYKANRYGRGTIEQRGARHQLMFDGLNTWYFEAVLQSFPLLIQCSLFLFGISLSGHMWSEQRTIAEVIIATTAFGVLFYLFTLCASLLSWTCPYQSPLSTILKLYIIPNHFQRFRIRMFIQTSCVYRTCRHLLQAVYHFVRERLRAMKAAMYNCFGKLSSPHSTLEDIEKGSRQRKDESLIRSETLKDGAATVISLCNPPSRKDPGALSVLWLLETSTDPEVLLAASRMVPQVEWHPALNISRRVYQLDWTFDLSVGQGNSVSPDQHDNAVTYCRSLIHIYVEMDEQTRRTRHIRDVGQKIRSYIDRLVTEDHLLNAVKIMFSSEVKEADKTPKFLAIASKRDILQVLHLLPYAKYEFACVEEYLQSSLRSLVLGVISSVLNGRTDLTWKSPGVSDCAMVVGRLLGFQFHHKDKRKRDKSWGFNTMMNIIYAKMVAVLERDQQVLRQRPSCEPDEHTIMPDDRLAALQEHIAMDILPFMASLLLAISNPYKLEFSPVDGSLFISKLYFDKSILNGDQNLDPLTKCSEDSQKGVSYLQASVRATAVALNKGDLVTYNLGRERFQAWRGHDTRFVNLSLDQAKHMHHHPWLLDYLQYLRTNYQGGILDLQDALLVSIYGLPDLSQSPDNIQRYLESIIFCMSTNKPVDLRRTALRAICAKCGILIPPDKASTSEWNVLPLVKKLSLLLLDVVRSTGNEKDPSDSEDLDDCIDRYSKLMSDLDGVDIWRARIINDGHLKLFISPTTSRFSFSLDWRARFFWRSLLPDFWTALALNQDLLLNQWSDIMDFLPEIMRLTLKYATWAKVVETILKHMPGAETRIQAMLTDKGDDPQVVVPLFDDLRKKLEDRRQSNLLKLF